ncbi:unnamed protein product [Caretta caretta]
MARLLTSQAFNVQGATRYWASQAVYWLFTPCKAIVYTQTGVVATVLSKTQKDASCRESPAHVPKLIAKHLPLRDLMPFSFTLLEKGECADQLAGIMEAVLRERESELQGQTTRSLWELVGALGQADTLDGLEDDLFASCFLAIACSLARHLSGAQQDLSSDASPHSMAVQALARVLHLRGSQPAVELTDQERGWQLLEEAQPEGFALLSRAMVIHPKQALKSIPWLLLSSPGGQTHGLHCPVGRGGLSSGESAQTVRYQQPRNSVCFWQPLRERRL